MTAEFTGMKNTLRISSLLGVLAFILPNLARAYESSWDGNHPDAKAEAWTWMGHVQEVEGTKLGKKGLGFIYYFARSEEQSMGTMTFRSAALTSTVDGEGKAFETSTIYLPKYDNGVLRARKNTLDVSFTAGKKINDTAKALPMTAADEAELKKAMAYFPGLNVAPGFKPKKSRFVSKEESGTSVDLTFYAIWPVLSAPEGKMTFLGQEGTWSFSEPMLVTVGKYNGKPVAGLSFLDRQWATKSFGVNAMGGLNDLLKYANAMKYSHSWSAFHAQNKRTNEWTFFHLWHQWKREKDVRDELVDYSGMLWMKNGTESGLVDSKDYEWTGSGFVHNKGRKVMMNYAQGRYGFFPSRADFTSGKMGLTGTLYASPALQNLNQPIPFYEGYAQGEGTWNGDEVRLQGRLESSRLMFRTQDYEQMLDILGTMKDGWEQPELQAWLKEQIAKDKARNPLEWIHGRLSVLASLLSEMDLKLKIFGSIISGKKAKQDANDPDVMLYY